MSIGELNMGYVFGLPVKQQGEFIHYVVPCQLHTNLRSWGQAVSVPWSALIPSGRPKNKRALS